MINVKVVSADAFRAYQEQFNTHNFLQSAQMYQVHLDRQRFKKVELLQFFEQDQVVGQTVVNYQQRYRFFTEAIILQGPLLHYDNVEQVKDCVVALERYLKQQGVHHVKMYPYLVKKRMDETMQTIEENKVSDVEDAFQSLAYTQTIDVSNTGTVAGQIFVKSLDDYTDVASMYQQLNASLKRDLKKAEESHVVISELQADELSVFYDILQETATEKQFAIQPFSYFETMKRHFGDDVRYVAAKLDCVAYRTYLTERIAHFATRLVELEQQPVSKKNKGYITDAKDQLQSYEKRLAFLETLPVEQTMMPLSAYMFIKHGDEIVSLQGGSYRKLIHFGGASLINWTTMQRALEEQVTRYNFYGTIETDQAKEKTGNFQFKRQFGGELQVMIGEFRKPLHPLFALLTMIKKER